MCNQYFQRKQNTEDIMKRKNKKENTGTEWVLCSEDWRDIVIMYIPNLNNIPIEDNFTDISQEKIKDTFLKYGK